MDLFINKIKNYNQLYIKFRRFIFFLLPILIIILSILSLKIKFIIIIEIFLFLTEIYCVYFGYSRIKNKNPKDIKKDYLYKCELIYYLLYCIVFISFEIYFYIYFIFYNNKLKDDIFNKLLKFSFFIFNLHVIFVELNDIFSIYKKIFRYIFNFKEIYIKNRGLVTNICYINKIEHLFCLYKNNIVCFKLPQFTRNINYEKKLIGNDINDIIYFNYEMNSEKLFISYKNQKQTLIYKFNSTELKKTEKKINDTIINMFHIPSNGIIILNYENYLHHIKKKYSKYQIMTYKYKIIKTYIKKKNYDYQIVKSYPKKLYNIQICPNKDKIIGTTKNSILLINIENFQLISIFNINCECQISRFIDKNNLFIINNDSIRILNKNNFKISFEYKNKLKVKDYTFYENKRYIILSLKYIGKNNYNHTNIIYEYKNNKITEVAEFYLDNSSLSNFYFYDNTIFIGNYSEILISKIK